MASFTTPFDLPSPIGREGDTTRDTCYADETPDDPVSAHLQMVIARVLRTGRGPSALVGWVNHELADSPSLAVGNTAEALADRLARRFARVPAAGALTVGG